MKVDFTPFLLVFLRFYRVLPSLIRFLLGFTGFYWVLLGFSRFDWVQ